MGKALVINGADFSALKIDEVTIPRELDETTLAWITASGNTFTTPQKNAIDDLVLALKANNNSLMSKIKRLWLPMIAGSKATSLYEYMESVNSASSFDATQQGIFDKVEFVSGQGIYPNNQESTQALIVDAEFAGNTADISFFSLNALAYDPSLDNTALGIGCPNYIDAANFAFSVAIQSVGQSRVTRLTYPNNNDGTRNRYLDTQSNKFDPLLRGVVSNSESVKFLASGGTLAISSSSNDVTSNNFTGLSILRGEPNYLFTNGSTPIAMYVVGDGTITEGEAKALKGASEALLAAMNSSTNVEDEDN